MKFEVQWTISAARDLQSLDSPLADRITKKVAWFATQSNPLRHAQTLEGAYNGIFRFRIGEYRVLFKKDNRGQIHILMILRIKHRREAYR